MRSAAQISNDISEGIPVTLKEALRVVHWERRLHQRTIDKLNTLRHRLLMLAAKSVFGKSL